jgi:spermidine synthase
MVDQNNHLGKSQNASGWILIILLILFFMSGCAALIYEIVWFQMLQLIVGSSAVSLSAVLGTYMGGLCLGSLVLPRIVSPRRHPIRVYAFLEMGIAVLGIMVLLGIPFVDRLYMVIGKSGVSGILLRGAVCMVCLLPPTILMGATLPAVSRWLETTPRGVSWMGFFYGGNTLGAVFGCLFAGFYLLRVHDIAIATYAAAALNILIALSAFGIALKASYHPQNKISHQEISKKPISTGVVYVAIGLSGMSALGAEVIWTRLLSLTLGGTVYTFSIILAVFLLCLGIGSHIGSFLSRKTKHPREILGWCQILLAASISWTAIMAVKILPHMTINQASSGNVWKTFAFDLGRSLLAVLPPTILWGASFPLALAAAAKQIRDPGKLVGGIYAANTIGAILGGVGFSLIFIPLIGTQQSQRLIMGISLIAGALLIGPRNLPYKIMKYKAAGLRPISWNKNLARLLAIGVAAFLVWSVSSVPIDLVAWGRRMPDHQGKAKPLFLGEGMNSSIAVTETGGATKNFHVSGKVVASSDPQDMRLQGMLGHIPVLLHPNPKTVLVVGCGAGVTAGTFVNYPSIDKIVLCEIESLIPEAAYIYFGNENNFILDDPRIELIIDDARHYILKTKEKFDIITSDPIHPWIKGSAALYSQEYFQLCRDHLKPGGLITQWVPLYESDLDSVKSEMATFFKVFPNGTIWSNDFLGMGYDVVLMGAVGILKIDLDELQLKLRQDDFNFAASSLRDLGFRTGMELIMTYTGRTSDLKLWLKDAEINRDRNFRLQYLAGMGLEAKESQIIFSEIMDLFQYPEDLFSGSEPLRQQLRKAFSFGSQEK